ncbi:MAG: hypothetical protein U0270_16005 [Labilithrix sp.]
MKLLNRAVIFTFLAHGAAMLGMLLFLLPLVPGGGGAGTDLDRMIRIAGSPIGYRLGWLGWQITAVSDLLLAAALVRVTDPGTRARKLAIATAAFVVLAVIPDQTAQFLLVTRGYELARMGAEARDTTDFIAFEDMMFPLTSGWAAVLYTLGAIGWALVLREVGIWSRALARLSPPMLVLFCAISVAPILPLAIRPKPELIGAGNALAFTVLEGWFVLVWWLLRSRAALVADE